MTAEVRHLPPVSITTGDACLVCSVVLYEMCLCFLIVDYVDDDFLIERNH